MPRSRLRLIVVGLVLVLVAAVGAELLWRSHEGSTGTTRVMVYGDSITQGSSGDWTWRCRLYEHLRAQGVAVNFVGPRNDLKVWTANEAGSQKYADPHCDRDHAALWAMRFSSPQYDLSDTVARYHPDVVVAMIGINDVVWGISTMPRLEERWRSEIASSRKVDPGIDFVLEPVPDTWAHNVPAYNEMLRGLGKSLDSPDSRVVSAALPSFTRSRDTIDDAHPTPDGEVRIAASAADALAEIGVGNGWKRPLPHLPYGPWFAPEPTARAVGRRLVVTWPEVNYANAMRVQYLDTAVDSRWHVTGRLTGNGWSMAAKPGHTYQVRLQPVKGYRDGGTLSSVHAVRIPSS